MLSAALRPIHLEPRERGGKTWEACKGDRAREAFRAEIEAGTVHGSLAFAADEPAGWCRYGPVSEFDAIQHLAGVGIDPHDVLGLPDGRSIYVYILAS